MRVIVEVCSGPSRGHRIAVRSGQTIRFGRTEWADMVFPHDDRMSSVHFSVEATNDQCLLHDLKSANGTQLNQNFVTEATVRDGDTVVAGSTQFKICVEGGAPAAKVVAGRAPDVVRDSTKTVLSESQAKPSFRTETCASGITLITGNMFGVDGEPAAVSEMAGPLSDRLPCYLIVDFKKADQPAPDLHSGAVPLFDWLPEEVAAVNSPLIIPPSVALERNELLDAVWDQDAAVVIYSRQASEALVRHLRAATCLNLDGSMPTDRPKKGMLGYCWPSVLASLLAFRTPGFVRSLLSGIDAVLIEIPDLPGTWQIYAEAGFPDVLRKMGFREVTADEMAQDSGAAPHPG